MSFTKIDGYMLRRFIINGANLLINNRDRIDELNVFPVPDGDTGTNMSMTAAAAAEFVKNTNSPNIYEVAKAASDGALRGARGNSGVILSQIFRGIAKGLEGKTTADCKELASAFERAKDTAYKAVMKPKEGTILTIIRALADKAAEVSQSTDSIEQMLKAMLAYAESVLEATPDMLQQLKQAGVVDAGGSGLLLIIRGGYENIGLDNDPVKPGATTPMSIAPSVAAEEDIKFGYCTEFFINLAESNSDAQEELTSFYSEIGDSLVVVADEDIIKIHVHTNHPGLVLERALKLGSLDKIKIENMRIQHTNLISFSEQKKQTEKKDFGFACVAAGEGMHDIFKQLGCDEIITGGQTMNPSTEDILSAVENINADNVFVLPNNKNILLAAQQAAYMCKDKRVYVIPSATIPQGISAMVAFMPNLTAEENADAMSEAMEYVTTGQVTYAVRSTTVDGREINKDDYLFMLENTINNTDTSLNDGLEKLVDDMIEANKEAGLVSLYYGADITEEDARKESERLSAKYPDIEFELRYGGQPVYYYIVSVE